MDGFEPFEFQMLIRLDILDKDSLVPDTVEKLLDYKAHNRTMPIIGNRGHLHLKCNFNKILYTESELVQVHMHFFHQTVSKLHGLIICPKAEEATPDTEKLLKEIFNAWCTCQLFPPMPRSFLVSLCSKMIFNHEVALGLMVFPTIPVLRVANLHTHFSATTFINGQNIEIVWKSFVTYWECLYPGHLDRMRFG